MVARLTRPPRPANRFPARPRSATVCRGAVLVSETYVRNFWYPLVFSKDIPVGGQHATRIFGRPVVLFRDSSGVVKCLEDRCPHRSAPLSGGLVINGRIECPYHGWQFDGQGQCAHVPTNTEGQRVSRRSSAPTLPAVEIERLIWVWPGDPSFADPTKVNRHPELESKRWTFAEAYFDIDGVPNDLAIENALDNAHVHFTHEGTIGYRKNAQPLRLEHQEHEPGMKGRYYRVNDPSFEPVDYTFERPCMTRCDMKLRPSWRVIQIMYWVPLERNKTRYIFRIGRDFLRHAPFLTRMMVNRGDKILSQDLGILRGQLERIQAGGEPFQTAVQADGLCVRYRKWKTKLEAQENPWFERFVQPDVDTPLHTIRISDHHAKGARGDEV